MPGQTVMKAVMNALYYSGGAAIAGKSMGGLGSILMLHRVGKPKQSDFSPNNHLNVSPKFLDVLLASLSRSDVDFVDLDEASKRIREGGGRRFVAVTLDDGYRNNLENAVPIFRKYNVPYTIYVAPGLVDGRAQLWWEDLEQLVDSRDSLQMDLPGGRREIPMSTLKEKTEAFEFLLQYFTSKVDEDEQRRQMRQLCELHSIDCEAHRARSIMNWQELRELSRDPLCTLGAHTIHHFAVARLSKERAAFEMEESRRLIEIETGARPRHFAYPYGYPAAAGERDFELARKAGFSTAVTTRHGVCYGEHVDHLTALPRISLNGNFQKKRYVRTMLSGATTRLANRGARLNVG